MYQDRLGTSVRQTQKKLGVLHAAGDAAASARCEAAPRADGLHRPQPHALPWLEENNNSVCPLQWSSNNDYFTMTGLGQTNIDELANHETAVDTGYFPYCQPWAEWQFEGCTPALPNCTDELYLLRSISV